MLGSVLPALSREREAEPIKVISFRPNYTPSALILQESPACLLFCYIVGYSAGSDLPVGAMARITLYILKSQKTPVGRLERRDSVKWKKNLSMRSGHMRSGCRQTAIKKDVGGSKNVNEYNDADVDDKPSDYRRYVLFVFGETFLFTP